MKRTYGFLFVLAFALSGCAAATGVGGLFGPTQLITQDGTGCVTPAVPGGAVTPPMPAPMPIVFKMNGDTVTPIYPALPVPSCMMHIVTASGGPTAGGIGQWLLAVATGIFAMVK